MSCLSLKPFREKGTTKTLVCVLGPVAEAHIPHWGSGTPGCPDLLLYSPLTQHGHTGLSSLQPLLSHQDLCPHQPPDCPIGLPGCFFRMPPWTFQSRLLPGSRPTRRYSRSRDPALFLRGLMTTDKWYGYLSNYLTSTALPGR